MRTKQAEKIREMVEQELQKPEAERNYQKIERLTKRWSKAAGVSSELDAAAARGIDRLTADSRGTDAEQETYRVEVQRHPQWMQIAAAAACLAVIGGTTAGVMRMKPNRAETVESAASVQTETTVSTTTEIAETQPILAAEVTEPTPEPIAAAVETAAASETVTEPAVVSAAASETTAAVTEQRVQTDAVQTAIPAQTTVRAAETAAPVQTTVAETQTTAAATARFVQTEPPTERYVVENSERDVPEIPGFRIADSMLEGSHWTFRTDPVTGAEQKVDVRIEQPAWRITAVDAGDGAIIPAEPTYLPEGMEPDTENAPEWDGLWYLPPRQEDGSFLFDNDVIFRQYPASDYFCEVIVYQENGSTTVEPVTVQGGQGFLCTVRGCAQSPYLVDDRSYDYTEYYLVWQTGGCINELWAFDIPDSFVPELFRIAESVQPAA